MKRPGPRDEMRFGRCVTRLFVQSLGGLTLSGLSWLACPVETAHAGQAAPASNAAAAGETEHEASREGATALPRIILQVPQDCGSEAEFRGALTERLSAAGVRDLPDTHVRIEPANSGFELWLESGAERRTLRDPKCRDLFRAAVVMVVAHAERRRAPAPETPRTASEEKQGPATAALESRGLGLTLSVGPNFGLLPRPAWGVSLEGSWRTGRWGGALSLRYLAPVEKEYRAPVELHARAFGAHLGAWFEPWPELRLHAGGVAHAVLGRGVGSQVEGSGVAWAAGPMLGAIAVPTRTRYFWVGLGAELQLEVVRPSFEIVPYEQIFRSSLAVGSVFLAIAPVFR